MLKRFGIGTCPVMPVNPPLSNTPLNVALNWRLLSTASPSHSFWLSLAGFLLIAIRTLGITAADGAIESLPALADELRQDVAGRAGGPLDCRGRGRRGGRRVVSTRKEAAEAES